MGKSKERKMRGWWVIALLCVLSATDATDHVVEPASSVKFPMSVPGEKGSLDLIGTAVRVKKVLFVSVQVYALGLYVDKKEAQAKLPRQITESLFTTLLSDEAALALTVRMEMVRAVGGDTMSGALKEAIEPRLAAIYNDPAKTAADMEAFTKQFDIASLSTGTLLTFSKTSAGTLITEVGGVFKGEITSPALARAFFSVFLGKDA